MQYYRLWIYSCNGVLGLTSAIFTVFAAFVLADVRLSLLGGVELYHPTFLYACAALILQCGVLQTIGCLGAQRLSHKLLHVYWVLLLLLTIGDVVVGLVWVFKLDKVKQTLRTGLTTEFISKYSTDPTFTRTWNKVQSQEHCCGVNGPQDFNTLYQQQLSPEHPLHENSDPNVVLSTGTGLLSLPESCCTFIYVPASSFNQGGTTSSKSSSSSAIPFPGWGFGSLLHSTKTTTTSPTATTSDGTISSPTSSASIASSSFSSNFNFTNYPNSESDEEEEDIQVTTAGILRHNQTLQGDVDDGGGGYQNDMALIEPMTLPLLLSSTDNTNSKNDINLNSVISNEDNFMDNNITTSTVPAVGSSSTIYPISNSIAAVDDSPISAALYSLNKQLSHKRRHSHKKNKHGNNGNSGSSVIPGMITNSYDNVTPLINSVTKSTEEFVTNLPDTVTSTKTKLENAKTDGLPSVSRSHSSSKPTGADTERKIVTGEISIPFICQRHHRYHSHSTTTVGSNSGSRVLDSSENTMSSILSSTSDYSVNIASSSTTQQSVSQQSIVHLNNNGKNGRRRRKRSEEEEEDYDNKDFTSSTIISDTDDSSSTIFTEIYTATGSPLNNKVNVMSPDYDESYASLINLNDETLNRLHTDQMKKFLVYHSGCVTKLRAWLDHVSGIMFILGFCIIGFVKTCFLIILHYEIREMIEKIHMLETELPVSPTRSTHLKYYTNPHPHPLLANPHRASTVSAGGGYAGLPLIKSPEGSFPSRARGYTSYNRRPSNFERERSNSHSAETVNMTLLVTNASVTATPEKIPHQRHSRSNSNAASCTHSAIHYPCNYYQTNIDDTSLCIKVPKSRRSSSASVTYTTTTTTAFPSSLSPQPGPSSRFYHQPFSTTSAGSNSSASTHGCPTSYNHPPNLKQVRNPGPHHNTGLGGYGCNSSFSSRDENEMLSVSMENLDGGSPGSGREENIEEHEHEQEQQPERQNEEETTTTGSSTIREQEIRNWVAVAGNSSSADSQTRHDHKAGEYGSSHQNNSSISSGGSNERQRRNGNNNVDCYSIPMSFLGTAV